MLGVPRGLANLALLWALPGLLLACGHASSTRTPDGALAAYARALERGDVESAYELLSPEAQLGLGPDEFARLARSSPESTKAFASLLLARDQAPKTIVTTTCGQEILLILEDGRWRVAPATIDIYPMRTPRESARSFVLAFDADRFDVLYRLMPEAKREELTLAAFQAELAGEKGETMTTSVDALRLAMDTSPLEIIGNRASLPYGKGRVLALVLEGGSWRVESF